MGYDNVDPPKHKYADLSDKKVSEIEFNVTARVLFMSVALVLCCLFLCLRGCEIPASQYSEQDHEERILKMLIDAKKDLLKER